MTKVTFTSEYFYMTLVLYIVTTVIIAILLIISLYSLKVKWTKEAPWTSRLMWALEPVSLLCFMMAALFSALTRYEPWATSICLPMIQTLVSSYGFAKTFMYMAMVLRLQVVYGPSAAHRYPPALLISFFIYSTITSLGTLAAFLLMTETPQEHVSGHWWCYAIYEKFGMIWIAGNDVLLCFIMWYLFVSRLMKLHTYIVSANTTRSNSQFHKLAVKYSILSFIGSFTSVLTMVLVGLTRLNFLAVLDVLISAICIALLGKQFDFVYEKYCCCLLLCCIRKYTKLLGDTKALQVELTTTTTSTKSG